MGRDGAADRADRRTGEASGVDWANPRDWQDRGRRSPRGDRTRARLIEVARRLMAEKGVDAVALRQIILEAGVANESAIHYHFGSREGLVIAILYERSTAEAVRASMLAEIADGERVPLHRAVEILSSPLAADMGASVDRDYIRIVAQVVRGIALEDRVDVEEPTTRAAVELVVAALDGVSEPLRSARIGSAMTLIGELWAARAAAIEQGADVGLDDRRFDDNLVDMVVGLLTAPVEAAEDPDPGPASVAASRAGSGLAVSARRP